jgi:hypothetical protein
MSIPALTTALPSITHSPATAPAAATGFGDTLKSLLNTVEDKAGEANKAIGNMLDGTDRHAEGRHDAATDRAGPQQTRPGVPGRDADAGLTEFTPIHPFTHYAP